MLAHFKTYYYLTKPGIIRGNAVVAAAGFLLASRGHIHIWGLIAMLAGLSLVIASACVFNNYIDRGIDAHMSRTKKRAFVRGGISVPGALAYASILGLLGASVLARFTNPLTVELGVFGFFMYVVVYGFAKRRSVYGTIVGSVSGAIPPVAGYTAVTGSLDLGAAILFFILVLWQMPHFYAIAIYRMGDYAAAKIPVLPIVSGIRTAKIHILIYVAAFVLAAASLTLARYTGVSFLVVSCLLGVVWFIRGARGFTVTNDTLWARQMFKFSLFVITGLCVMLSLDTVIP